MTTYGPSPLYAWEGSNDAPDHSRMNLAYWQHYDRVMAALAERGIQAHMLMKVYNKQVKWPAHGSDEEKLFFRWLVARYAAYPNVIWDFSKEAHNEKDLAYKQGWLKWLRENDPYHHLTTVHDDDKANDSGAYDELTDFRADQQHSQMARCHHPPARRAAPGRWRMWSPTTNTAPAVSTTRPTARRSRPRKCCARAWEIQMAGGYMAYYYTYTAWDVVRPLDVPPGYAYFKHFGDFWRATEYWKLEPSDKLVSEGWCLANPGREYVVFQKKPNPSRSKSPAQERRSKPSGSIRTPASASAAPLNNGTAKLTPPADWGKAPLVLHVTAAR